MSKAFCPPKPNPIIIGMVKAFLPDLMKRACHGLDVHILPEDIERLQRYRGERMLLLPNHPGYYDPYLMLALSARVKEDFRFVAAREIFDSHLGLQGWLMQRCGVYSLIRGKTDRESFRTTREILSQGKNRLVIFIEGEVSYENDVLIPLETGVIQLAFMVLDDLYKKQPGAPLLPVYLTPVAMRYRYKPGAEQKVAHGLSGLEHALCLSPADHDPYHRFRAIGEHIVGVQENYLSLKPAPDTPFNDRILAVKDKILKRMELFLDIAPPAEATILSRIRAIRNRIDSMLYSYDDTSHLCAYEHRMVERLRKTLAEFYTDLDRVVQFLTYQAGRVAHGTVEQQMELLGRLEKEVFGTPRTFHPRTAVIRVGEIFNLSDYHATYQENKKEAVQTVAALIENDIRRLLDETKTVVL